MQKLWYIKLVKMADDSWQKFKLHQMITDQQVHAAKALKLKKAWLYTNEDMRDCPGCGSQVLPYIAICPNCRAILDEKAAADLKFAVAR
jgi:hypothetical protein